MSIQARPLSFADQVCQNNKKTTKLKNFLDAMEKVVPWTSSSQGLSHITIAQVVEAGSPIRCKLCCVFIWCRRTTQIGRCTL